MLTGMRNVESHDREAELISRVKSDEPSRVASQKKNRSMGEIFRVVKPGLHNGAYLVSNKLLIRVVYSFVWVH